MKYASPDDVSAPPANAISVNSSNSNPPQHGFGDLQAGERSALLATARRLSLSPEAEAPGLPLRGRHVAISGADHQSPSALLFERAAASLGARVSHIGPDALVLDDRRTVGAARLLGTLYDAVDCVALQPERAQLLQKLAGVPIYSDLGGNTSPLRELVPALEAESRGSADPMLCLVQAVLLEALG